MAGSYNHVRNGWSLIENMGDAYETVEELLYLVQSEIGTEKAHKLLKEKFYPMANGKIKPDRHYEKVQTLMNS